MVDLRGDIKHAQNCKFVVSSIVSRTLDPSLFTYDLIKLEQSSPYSTYYVKSVKSFDGKYSLLDPAVLARTQNIGLEIARRTTQTTTHLCPKNTTTLTVNKRHVADDRMIRYMLEEWEASPFSTSVILVIKNGEL